MAAEYSIAVPKIQSKVCNDFMERLCMPFLGDTIPAKADSICLVAKPLKVASRLQLAYFKIVIQ